MQLIARTQEGEAVLAPDAKRGELYLCPTCGGPVRLRGGHHRQPHFYHRSRTSDCAQKGKGVAHLQAQLALHRLLPGSTLEHPFSQIGRIADLYWPIEETLFEIQYSPISEREVEARERDYASIGLRLIWILSDHRFNRWRCSSGEVAMCKKAHLFTSINAKGEGRFYQQPSRIEGGLRTARSEKESIDFTPPLELIEPERSSTPRKKRAYSQLYKSILIALIERIR